MSERLSKLTVLTAAALLLAILPARASELLGVRFGPDGEKTRVVFDIEGAPVFSISGDEQGHGRLLVDFADLSISAADNSFRPGKGHIQRYGFGAGPDGATRAVLDFGRTAKIVDSFLLEPKDGVTRHRLVIDLESADKKAFLASLPKPYPDLASVIEEATSVETVPDPDPVAAPPSPSQKQVALPQVSQPAEKLVVVIDPGHGGGDPGSQGQSGTLEKHVTLAAAKELEDILTKRGRYEVVLTRNSDKDSRIKSSQRDELARREALAREAGAELFISLHADALAEKAVRGGSVYTLSEQGTERSAKIAKSEGDYVVYDLDLERAENLDQVAKSIMLDVAQDRTITASSQLADALIDNLTGKTPLLNRSHRTGDLRVLLAPDVPAVLLEMAFISNAKDEANLNSPVWRKRAMTAVADAIDQYFEEHQPRRVAGSAAGGAR